ncbi:hypothetical protein [Eisenbergiella porci]|uniref:hypothetical protein n=1 Tax=Eisenbergiella porci TaxID=2652274 RepID=UPI002A82EB8B|nr:hypothetical protein [Eisenbergiella porci]
MDEIKEMRNQIRTLRWCNLITQITFLIVTIILQVQYFRTRSYYQEVIQQNQEMIAELEFQNAVLQRIISISEEVNGDGPQRAYLEEKHGFDGQGCMYDRKILQIIARK